MHQSIVLPEILELDPVRDHQRITFLSCRCDFPFDTTRALEFALFRTFCVPSIGGLLDTTREFGNRPQKRYDDTDLIMSEIMEYGYDSARGQRAIARMNEIHARFHISNSDYLYVLSTFVYEPIRWNAAFGWRLLHEKERLALFYFWRAVGERMHIHEVPESYEEFEKFNRAYEMEHFRPNPGSKRVATATMNLFASWVPAPFRSLVPPVIRALMDEALLSALELPPAPERLKRAVAYGLRMRGRLGQLFATNDKPVLRTEMKHPSYPNGYRIETIGPGL